MTDSAEHVCLGEALVAEGVISESQLSRALAEQKTADKMLGEILVEQGYISASAMLRVLARQLDVPYCDLRHGLFDFSLFGDISGR